MPIFIDEGGKLKKLKVDALTKEKNLQSLIESNLLEVLEMHFLATEYVTTFGGRIDTLAVDSTGAPVIIEYKLNKNENVINQGLSYLRWLKAQKVEFFEMLVIKKLGREIADKIPIDWGNPRVICIAESYSKFDLDTVEVIPMRLELFKYRLYEKGVFSLEPLNTVDKVSETSKAEKRGPLEVSTDMLVDKASSTTKELFEVLRSRILQMDEDIVEKETNYYIAYRVSKNFAEVHIGKKAIKLFLRPVEFDDPLNKIEKIPDSYNWALNRRVYLNNLDELEYVMKLVEQAYKDVI
jgi:predicted transport protein